jgi:AcrR family transcriptional regulator
LTIADFWVIIVHKLEHVRKNNLKEKTMARKTNVTRLEIIRVASRLFLERGYSATTIRAIAEELNISPGHLMFYFPSKDHLLAEMVDILCDFQWQLMKRVTDEGATQLMAICFEMTTMASACEESEIARDFYLSTYTSPLTLEIIRKSDAARAKEVFGEFCPEWSETEFREAETLISGIEYATFMTTESSAPLDVRISGALNAIMLLYNVPEEIRRDKIRKALSLDYRSMGRQILSEFIKYVEETNENAFEELYAARKR